MPERSTAFNATTALGLGDMLITALYDFTWVVEYASQLGESNRPLIVDVGGGKGQALKAILVEIPNLPVGACVLQDQAEVIQQALAEYDECLGYDKLIVGSFCKQSLIFELRPRGWSINESAGALVYYIRRVLSDWSDDCVPILEGACIRESAS